MNVSPQIDAPAPTEAQARRAAMTKQARIWVSQTFFGTLLKQMHDSPFRSELFSGGRGGQAFSSLLDQHLTQRMAGGQTTRSLAESIVRKVERAHPNMFTTESLNTDSIDPRSAARVTPADRD